MVEEEGGGVGSSGGGVGGVDMQDKEQCRL